jgi:hypothetical protein
MDYYLLYDGGIVDDSGAKQKWLHFPRAREIAGFGSTNWAPRGTKPGLPGLLRLR